MSLIASLLDAEGPPRALLAVLSCVGVVCSLGAVTAFLIECRRSWSGRRAKGTVVELQRVQTNPRRPLWVPIVEFRINDRVVRFHGVGGSPANHVVGDQVRVLFYMDDPECAAIDSFSGRWLLPLVLALFGAAFGGFAWLLARS